VNPTETMSLSLAGQTQRWRFTSGPTANQTYEHTFNEDGTVTWRSVGPSSQREAPKPTTKKPPTRYASFEVDLDLHLVSYLSDSGYTLTVLVNARTRALTGFASNQTEWYPVQGVLES
jgi:MoaF N-terminal domain